MSKYSPYADSTRVFEPHGTANSSGSAELEGAGGRFEESQEEGGVLDADEDYYGAKAAEYGDSISGMGAKAMLEGGGEVEGGYYGDPFMNVPRYNHTAQVTLSCPASFDFWITISSLDAYLNQLKADFHRGGEAEAASAGPRTARSGRTVEPQPLEEHNESGAEPNLLDLAAAPVEVGGKLQVGVLGGDAQQKDEGGEEVAGEEAAVYDEMSEVLMHREREFLGFLCEPLEVLDDATAEQCVELLADELRSKVSP
jgi:hypothetical protein